MGLNLSHNVEPSAVLLTLKPAQQLSQIFLTTWHFLCREHTESHLHHSQQKPHWSAQIRYRNVIEDHKKQSKNYFKLSYKNIYNKIC